MHKLPTSTLHKHTNKCKIFNLNNEHSVFVELYIFLLLNTRYQKLL